MEFDCQWDLMPISKYVLFYGAFKFRRPEIRIRIARWTRARIFSINTNTLGSSIADVRRLGKNLNTPGLDTSHVSKGYPLL